MSFYKENIYPYLVDKFGDPPPIKRIREQIIRLAQGNVLEIGAGSGANFLHYDFRRVSQLYALEPNPGMIKLAERRMHATKMKLEFIDLPGERIPLKDETIDTVVSTFTLCTITKIIEAMNSIARVLKPSGQLIFFELGLAPDRSVQRWQKHLEPICRWLFQGLYLTRDIPLIIKQSGFQIEEMESGYISQFPKSLSYCWWGIATKTEDEP
jgi:ubiquinone/menaquinone biosynthesis C-methylase UbiE